jgi:putative hydrolase of the HAD superfamily
MITTIFFDIGNVLVGFDHGLIWQRLALFSALSSQELQQRIQDSGVMKLHETGKLTSLDFFYELQQEGKLDSSLSYEKFTRLWADIFWEQVPVIQLANTLQQHYTIGLLSNTGEIHWNWLVSRFSIFSQVDKKILSFQVGYLKPSKEIYQEAIQQSQSQPEQCVYIDDIEAYANASQKLGILGIHYQTPEQLKRELKELDIL